jgi:hypothetical protein
MEYILDMVSNFMGAKEKLETYDNTKKYSLQDIMRMLIFDNPPQCTCVLNKLTESELETYRLFTLVTDNDFDKYMIAVIDKEYEYIEKNDIPNAFKFAADTYDDEKLMDILVKKNICVDSFCVNTAEHSFKLLDKGVCIKDIIVIKCKIFDKIKDNYRIYMTKLDAVISGKDYKMLYEKKIHTDAVKIVNELKLS